MKLEKPCKLVNEHLSQSGYPYVQHNGKWTALCRVVLEKKQGHPIKEGYECCHYCDEPRCVEEEHLWEGSHAQNMHDSIRKGRHKSSWAIANRNRANKTHCPKGHEYTEENTRIYQGRRFCRECHRIESNKRYWKNK